MEKEIKIIEDIRSELLNSVNDLSDEECNKEVEEGRWTIMQVLDHLYLMERSLTKTIQLTLAKGEEQQVDSKPIHYAVNRSTKVDAPPFVVPSEEKQTLQQMKEKLEASRKDLLQFIGTTTKEDLQKKAYPHPIFGQIRLDEWVPFIGYHEKRHLEQIEELKSTL
ncbi:DinB family protein [Rossellomorea sp. KS-H15a]|uniref:DinB family protein n=1 Tax=Rossellomorea sp. KS-H15a TaxID=2963940 RepID=UPI0020C5E715|nr:DinB family protein [Rossellomorea sp. KS-H15a]UTE75616.1 DinB family protein [Rossellomorea sp. KS-H15a]